MFYVYVLFNAITKRYYIGYTPDLRKKIKKHYSGQVQSTKSKLDYKLVHYSSFIKSSDALDFEKYLKSGPGVAFMEKHFLKSVKKL